MPSDRPCPPAAEYQQLLSGVAPPDQVEALASHLDACPHCANTIQSLLSADTLGEDVRSAADRPALRQLPPGVLSRLLALSQPKAADPSEPDLYAPTLTREPTPATPGLIPSSVGASGATEASLPEPRLILENTLFTPSAMTAPLKPGEVGVFAGYRVIEALGQGGMGVVYLAEDMQLQRPVALKVMKPDLAADPSARKRFLAEARAAARIRSDHVVTIYQTGEHGGAVFAAMELLRGSALDGWLKANRGAPMAELARIGREAALGLAAAHEQGLIHRDIKPGNIWVETGGRVKLLDFGLARTAEGGVDLTKSGAVIGTPAYMAPEQARGEKVDHRADLFSLGCVLYRMTTGKMPFRGDTVMGVLTALAVDHPPAAHELNPDVPARLSALITKLLSKNPADRPRTARAVADELQAIRTELTAPAVVPMAQPVLIPAPGDFDFDARTEVAEPARARKKTRAAAPDEDAPADAPRSRRPLILAGAVAALLLVLGVVTAQLVFTTANGTLIVEVDDTADVRFRKGKLEVYDESGTLKYTLEPSEKNRALPPGKYRVKVVGADGVQLETEAFELQRKGQAYVRVKAVPGADAVAANDPKKPDPKQPDPVKPAAPAAPSDTVLILTRDCGVEAPAPGIDPKKPWTIEGYFTPLTESTTAREGADLIKITDLGAVYFGRAKYGISADGFQLGEFVKVGQRVHLAAVRTDTRYALFVNGVLSASYDTKSQAEVPPLGPDAKLRLGPLPEGREFSVQEVRVSQTARYTQNFAPPGRHVPDKDTLALYHCDEGRGDKLADSSGNGRHAKITGPLWGTSSGRGSPAPAPGFVLRKSSWELGPADNVLPGLVPRPAILDGVGRWQIVPTTAPAWAVAFSPDGRWVATADFHFVRIYDAATGALRAVSKRTNGGQLAGANLGLDWSADSRWLRAADFRGVGFDNGDLFAADGTRSPVPYIQHAGIDFGWNPKFPVFACVVHGTQDRIQIIDPTQPKPIEIEAKQGSKGRAVWSPNGEWLLVVREDKSAQLFARDGKPGAKLAGEVNPAVAPAWSADGIQIAALASDTEIGFWTADGTAGKKTGKHEKPILALHWKPDGKLLAASDAEFKRHFWKTDGTSEWVADTKDVTPGFVWAKDGKGFFTPGKFWPAVGNPSFTVTRAPDKWEMVSPDQASVALAKRGVIEIAELADGAPKDIGWTVPQTRDGAPWWSPDGKRLAVAEQNGVSLYDARDPKKVVRLGGGAGVHGLNRAAFSPKGDRLAVANDIGYLFVCEPTGKPLRALTGPMTVGATLADAIHDLHWHPDGKFLAVTTGAATVTVYDTETGKVEATTSVPGIRPGGSAVFSPSNPDHLLIAHPDGAALWRWKVEKEPLQKFPGLGKLVPGPDGKRVLSLTAGGGHHGNDFVAPALLSPDLRERAEMGGKELMPNNNHPGAALAWHPDGKHLIVTRLAETRSIQVRALDGKVVEEVKPEGIDVTWLEWVSPVARRNVLVGRIGQGPDTYLFDLGTKKLTPLGKVPGEVTVSPDGKYLIALEGSSLTYWNIDTKEIAQRVVLLPDGEFVALSAAGEVLGRSANADAFYRYLVEDKTGKLLLKTPAEMAAGLPKSAAPPAEVDGRPVVTPHWKPTAEQQAFLAAVAALPPNDRTTAVLRKMQELNPVFSERPPVAFVLDPQDGLPTSCRVTSPITFEGWPLAALTSLKKLDLTETHIADFRPLSAIALEEVQIKLILDNVASEEALKWMPTLKAVNGIPVKDFWAERDAVRTEIDKMTGVAAALSPEDQTVWVRKVMKRLHPKLPDADFGGTHVVKDEQGLLKFWGHQVPDGVYDFSPVRALSIEVFETGGNLFDAAPLKHCKRLKAVHFGGRSHVRDLSPLAGHPLEKLTAGGCARDLSPLKGMPLKELSFAGVTDSDLSPLKGMPLEVLHLGGAKDLAPLAGLPLKKLVSGHYSPIDDLSPLKGMPLEALLLHGSKVTDISPLAGMKLKEFYVGGLVADVTPLKDMPLTQLDIHRGLVDPALATLPLKNLNLRLRLYSEAEEKALRGLKLESINGMMPGEFWKDVEKRRKEDADKVAEMAKVPLEQAALEKAIWVCGQYPKVKIEGGAVVEVAAGHANGGLDNPFAVLLAFPKVRKLTLESGGDYSALAKLAELEELNCPPAEVAFNRLTLKQMPKLKTINGKPAKEVLAARAALAPLDPGWLKSVAALPPEVQVAAVHAELKKRNPEFDRTRKYNKHVIDGGAVVELELDGKITDLTPVRALPGLKKLRVSDMRTDNAVSFPLTDLSPLSGLPLTHLDLTGAEVTDLSPLRGMPLQTLNLFLTKVTDLTPLAGMPLERLGLRGCPVEDLTPIKGLKLKDLHLHGTQVTDLKPVAGMPLESLTGSDFTVDLTPLKGMKLKELHLFGNVTDLSLLKGMPLEALTASKTQDIKDLTALEGMPLKNLRYHLNLERDGKVLRSLKSLEVLNDRPARDVLDGK